MNIHNIKRTIKSIMMRGQNNCDILFQNFNESSFIDANKEIFKNKEIKSKEIITNIFNSCEDFKTSSSENAAIEFSLKVKDIIDKILKDIKTNYGESLINIEAPKITNYANLKLVTTIEYIITDKEELFQFFITKLSVESPKKISYNNDEQEFTIPLGNYNLIVETSLCKNKQNLGKYLRKAKQKNSLTEALIYLNSVLN